MVVSHLLNSCLHFIIVNNSLTGIFLKQFLPKKQNIMSILIHSQKFHNMYEETRGTFLFIIYVIYEIRIRFFVYCYPDIKKHSDLEVPCNFIAKTDHHQLNVDIYVKRDILYRNIFFI